MEGQQSLHDPPNQFGNGYFPPATAPKTGDRCSQISPRSSIRCVTPCEPICAPLTTQDNTNHLRTLKHRCEPFMAEREDSDPEAPPDRTRRNGQDKERGSRSAPRSSHTVPQCGSEQRFTGVQTGVNMGVPFGLRGASLTPRSRNRPPFQGFRGFQTGIWPVCGSLPSL